MRQIIPVQASRVVTSNCKTAESQCPCHTSQGPVDRLSCYQLAVVPVEVNLQGVVRKRGRR